MQNRSKNWADVQLIFSSLAVALMLGLWGLFASRERVKAGAAGIVLTPEPVVTAPQPMLLPGQKLLLGGSAPQPQVVVRTTRRRGGSPVATTRSSRP